MNAPAGSHVATSHMVSKPAHARFERELQRKTYSQTVNEARQTLFEVARSANHSPTLPPGKKSVIDLLRKARQDMDSKALRECASASGRGSNRPWCRAHLVRPSRRGQSGSITGRGLRSRSPYVYGERGRELQ